MLGQNIQSSCKPNSSGLVFQFRGLIARSDLNTEVASFEGVPQNCCKTSAIRCKPPPYLVQGTTKFGCQFRWNGLQCLLLHNCCGYPLIQFDEQNSR